MSTAADAANQVADAAVAALSSEVTTIFAKYAAYEKEYLADLKYNGSVDMPYFIVITLLMVIIPWACFIRETMRQEPHFYDQGAGGKVVQMDSYRRIQDDRDQEFDREMTGGYLTPQHYKKVKGDIDLQTAALKKMTEDTIAYWWYLDIAGYACGPYSSEEMRERYIEKNFQMDEELQLREPWWPAGVYYRMGDLWESPSDYFLVKPKLPERVEELVREGINMKFIGKEGNNNSHGDEGRKHGKRKVSVAAAMASAGQTNAPLDGVDEDDEEAEGST